MECLLTPFVCIRTVQSPTLAPVVLHPTHSLPTLTQSILRMGREASTAVWDMGYHHTTGIVSAPEGTAQE